MRRSALPVVTAMYTKNPIRSLSLAPFASGLLLIVRRLEAFENQTFSAGRKVRRFYYGNCRTA